MKDNEKTELLAYRWFILAAGFMTFILLIQFAWYGFIPTDKIIQITPKNSIVLHLNEFLPSAKTIKHTPGYNLSLPFTVSHWWNILGFGVFIALIVVFLNKTDEFRYLKSDLLGHNGIFLFLVIGIGIIIFHILLEPLFLKATNWLITFTFSKNLVETFFRITGLILLGFMSAFVCLILIPRIIQFLVYIIKCFRFLGITKNGQSIIDNSAEKIIGWIDDVFLEKCFNPILSIIGFIAVTMFALLVLTIMFTLGSFFTYSLVFILGFSIWQTLANKLETLFIGLGVILGIFFCFGIAYIWLLCFAYATGGLLVICIKHVYHLITNNKTWLYEVNGAEETNGN